MTHDQDKIAHIAFLAATNPVGAESFSFRRMYWWKRVTDLLGEQIDYGRINDDHRPVDGDPLVEESKTLLRLARLAEEHFEDNEVDDDALHAYIKTITK